MTEGSALREFIAKYSKPFDLENDSYDRPPFAADIREGKNDPTYNVHTYHTKVPPRGILPYILHYTEPGDLILDPFCGSGMAGVAAMLCSDPPADQREQFPQLRERVGLRRAILNDLSPAACHIAYNYTTPVDVEELRQEFSRIKIAVADEFNRLYGTEHYEPAVGVYDPHYPEVDSRLKNAPNNSMSRVLVGEAPRTWELIDRVEVEHRLGYSVNELRRNNEWADVNLSAVEGWISIPATIQYTVFSDVYQCEGLVTLEEATGNLSRRGKLAGKPIIRKSRVARGCGKEFTLWEAAVDFSARTVANSFKCPYCQQDWEKRQLQKSGQTPVLVRYEYQGLNPNTVSDAPLRTTRKDRVPTRLELRRLEQIASDEIPSWYPTLELDMGREMMRHGMGKQGLSTVAEFWTPRNRRALAMLWNEIQATSSIRVRKMLLFAFTAIIFRVSRRRIVYFPEGGGWASTVISGTLYIPSLNAEAHVGQSFFAKSEDVIELARTTNLLDAVVVTQSDATNLDQIPPESIDYIFADPPFGKNIYYADCSLLWESWLNEFTDEAKEIVVNERRQGPVFKDLSKYEQLMGRAFAEMYRVLKPGRYATIEFNNSDGKVFEAIKRSILAQGFRIENMLLLDKKGKTYKQMKAVVDGENVVDKDIVFNLHKPAGGRSVVSAGSHDIEVQIAEVVRAHLISLPERIASDPGKYTDDHRTTATINSMLMNTLIPRGVSVERLNLPFIERVCSRYFRKVGQRWYLRGEAVGNSPGAERLIEEELAIDGEISAIEWIRQRFQAGPVQLGELKPLWMRATGLLPAEVSQQLNLEDLLTENFWKDRDTNKWREPTEEERERMNDDRSLRVLHDAERFVAGSLRRSTTDEERCEWVDVLFNACKAVEENDLGAMPVLRGFDEQKGYLLISRLFRSVLNDSVDPGLYRKAEKQARVASQRLNRTLQNEKEKAKANQRKERGPTLFEGIEDE